MATVVVSADEREVGEAIASKIAHALGHKLLGRSFLDRVGQRYGVKPERLSGVLDRATALRLMPKTRDLLLAYIQAATLEEMCDDDRIVCVNLAAHLYVRDVSHVLMVRVLSKANARTTGLPQRKRLSPGKVQKLLAKEKAKLARWSVDLFGVDEHDPSNYDMVISIGQIAQEKAIDIIKDMAEYRKFQPMTYSQRCLKNLTLAARVRVELLKKHPEIRVSVDGDTATVCVKCPRRQKQQLAAEIKETTGQISGIALAKVHAVTSMRALNEIASE